MSAKRARVDPLEESNPSTVTGESHTVKRIYIPLDVWLIIAENVDPFTLLQLARTSKELRTTFMSKTHSHSIWKNAFNQVGIQALNNSSLFGPSTASFLHEERCSSCDGDDATRVSFNLQKRWDTRACADGAIMDGRDLLRRYPVLHPEVLKSLPPADRSNRYGISMVKAMNVELINFVSLADTFEGQKQRLTAFLNSRTKSIEEVNQDGTKLEAWRNRMIAERRQNITTRIRQDLKSTYACNVNQVIHEIVTSNKALVSIPISLSDQEWDSVGPSLVAAVEASALAVDKDLLLKRRFNIRAHFDKMNKSKLFPCFPIFLEIPVVAQVLKSSKADHSWSLESEMWQLRSDVVKGIETAQRWIQLSFARIASSTLSPSDHAFPADVQAALDPPGSSPPPAEFAGIQDSENSTGFDAKDPATITNTKLSRLLSSYTMECFFYAGQEPAGYREVRQSRFEEMNSKDYKGPLFPQFNGYWHQILRQVLDQVQLDDDGAKKMSSYLETLGPNFCCGACSASDLLASELLKHIKSKHHGRPDDTPRADLVIYNGGVSQDTGSGGAGSAPAEEPLTRTRSGRI